MQAKPDNDAFPFAPWAIGLGLALLVLTGSAAFLTQWDYWHRHDLEKVSTPTAVGDTHYVQKPPGKRGPLTVKYQGQPLAMLHEGKLRDARLLRVDTDDSGYYSIYRTDEDGSKALYMKAAPNDYMEIGPAPSPAPSP